MKATSVPTAAKGSLSNITNGQCDGLGDASYVSTGAVTNATWQWNTIYNLGTVITDPTGFYETVTTAGTSGNFSPGPVFSGATTSDGTVVWTKGAAYPLNQHCAFKEFSQLYTDWSFNNGVTFPGWGWILAGGDSVTLSSVAQLARARVIESAALLMLAYVTTYHAMV